MTPAERSLAARAAVNASWAKTTNRSGRTSPAREAFMKRFEDQVDPHGKMPTAERKRRAESAMNAYMQGLARKRLRGRRTKNTSGRTEPAT